MVVSLLGVGKLFQIRVDYENDITRNSQLELESERLRSASSSSRPPPSATPHQKRSQVELNQAAASFSDAAARAAHLTD